MKNRMLSKSIIFFFLLLINIYEVFSQAKQWFIFQIPKVMRISLPSSMELQGGDYSKIKKIIIEKGYYDLSNQSKDYINSAFIFQQSGLNELKSEAFSTYARVIIDYYIDVDNGIGPILLDSDIPSSDLELIDSNLKFSIDRELSTQDIKIIDWYGTKLIQKRGFSVIVTKYLRQLKTNTPVYVEKYLIFDRGKEINITISARQNEMNTIYSDIWKIIDTIELLK